MARQCGSHPAAIWDSTGDCDAAALRSRSPDQPAARPFIHHVTNKVEPSILLIGRTLNEEWGRSASRCVTDLLTPRRWPLESASATNLNWSAASGLGTLPHGSRAPLGSLLLASHLVQQPTDAWRLATNEDTLIQEDHVLIIVKQWRRNVLYLLGPK